MISVSRFPFLALCMVVMSFSALAQAPGSEKFLGVTLTPASGTYLVLGSVNIRKAPFAGATRLGRFKKGEKIKVFARASADWLAVIKDGKKFGFVYEPVLRKIISEKIKADFSIPLTPISGIFMATKDVNVRAKPKTGSKRVARLTRGDRVEGLGRPSDAAWLAVKRDGNRLGYVYAPVLAPLIDGRLTKTEKGKITVKGGPTCSFAIHFKSRNATEESIFNTFDYDISFNCLSFAGKFNFPAFMFITEAPYDGSSKRNYQINIDILGIGDMFDEPVSVIFIYKPKKNLVVFDGISQKEFSSPPDILKKPAKDVLQALVGAVKMTVTTWNKKVWRSLVKASP